MCEEDFPAMINRALLWAAMGLVLAATGYGQTGVGQIQGTVSDPTGAVIPGAAVDLDQVQTSNKFHTMTSDVGFYVFPSLPPGEYRVSVSATGMQRWEGQVQLQLGQQAVVNAPLLVAGAAEQVTVAGD